MKQVQANRLLPRERTGHSKHPLPTTQEKTVHIDITIWSIPKSDWLCSLQPSMEKLYVSAKARLGADCGSHHELSVAKFRLKLKKVGKNHWIIQVWPKSNPYDYTVKVRNRFKGLDPMDRVPDELRTEVHRDIVQEAMIKSIPKKKKCKKAKWWFMRKPCK